MGTVKYLYKIDEPTSFCNQKVNKKPLLLCSPETYQVWVPKENTGGIKAVQEWPTCVATLIQPCLTCKKDR